MWLSCEQAGSQQLDLGTKFDVHQGSPQAGYHRGNAGEANPVPHVSKQTFKRSMPTYAGLWDNWNVLLFWSAHDCFLPLKCALLSTAATLSGITSRSVLWCPSGPGLHSSCPDVHNFFHPIPTSPHSESRFSRIFKTWVKLHCYMLHLCKVRRHCLILVKSHQSKLNVKSKGHSHFPPDRCTYAWYASAICLLNRPCFLNQVWLNAQVGWLDMASLKSPPTNTWKRNNLFKVQWKHRSFVIGKDLSRNLLV